MMQLINQPKGSAWCFACCVAMITKTTLEDVIGAISRKLFVPEKHPLRGNQYLGLQDAIIYLAKHGYQYGSSHHYAKPVVIDCTDLTLTIGDALAIPAILTTVSNTFGDEHLHSVVWDPEERVVLDPQHNTPQRLRKYKIREWAIVSEFTASI